MFKRLKSLKEDVSDREFKFMDGTWDKVKLQRACDKEIEKEKALNERRSKINSKQNYKLISPLATKKYIGHLSIPCKIICKNQSPKRVCRKIAFKLNKLVRLVEVKTINYKQKDHEEVVKELIAAGKHVSYILKPTETSKTTINVQIEIFLRRSADKQVVNLKQTLRYMVGGSKDLGKSMDVAQERLKEFEKRKLPHSLDGILDYACRPKMDPEEELTREERNGCVNYGLNIELRHYQVQSVNWMIRRENNPLGVYSEFISTLTTPDGTNWFYSPDFQMPFFSEFPRVSGGILCEEMGLGKTIELMAVTNVNKGTKKLGDGYEDKADIDGKKKWIYKSNATLIVAATSLVGQWEIELNDKSTRPPRIYKYYGASRIHDAKKLAQEYDFVLTTYGIMQRESGLAESQLKAESSKRATKKKAEAARTGKKRKTVMAFIPPDKHTLHHIEWHRVVLDESHSVKTIKNVQSKSCRNLRAMHRWCLTGTPFNTSLRDLDGQLRFVGMVAPLNSTKWWEEQEKAFVHQSRLLRGKNASLLKVINACVMRHKKDQTFNGQPIVELPSRQEKFVELKMSKAESEIYAKIKAIAKHKFDTLKCQGGVDRKVLQLRAALLPERMATSGVVDLLDLEEKYKRVLENPVPKEFTSDGLQHAKEESYNDVNECPICLEIPEDPLQTPCRHIFCAECIKGVLNTKPVCPFCRAPCKPQKLKKPPKKKEDKMESDSEPEMEMNIEGSQFEFDTKLDYLMNEIEKLGRESPNEKILIFTTFKKSLERVAERLIDSGENFRSLRGNMTMQRRTNQLKSFLRDKDCRIFLLSVRTGAVGITLTVASRIFMMEPLMNKALYDQAVNRCHRLGQKKIVHVQTLLLKDSIEPKIQKMAEAIKGGDVRQSSGRGKKGVKTSISSTYLMSLFE